MGMRMAVRRGAAITGQPSGIFRSRPCFIGFVASPTMPGCK
jgi:hypothetical protein